tara:strand:- start:3544 stop:3966 length:423 start_codon:yes stop_codon:yes gene_type:complete
VLDAVGKTIHVCDLKAGQGVEVDVIGNRQLHLYSLGAYYDLRFLFGVERVVVHIVQPRTGNPGSSWEVSLDELLAFGDQMREAARRTEDKDAACIASEKTCRFCQAAAVCPELVRQNIAVAEAMFDAVPPLTARLQGGTR